MGRIMIFGTFDILHAGHLDFFRQAKKLAEYLIVVVARDKFVGEAKNKLPQYSEETRTRRVRNSPFVNKAILGSRTHNFYRTIRTYKPDIIALGYDQKPNINKLKKEFRRHRLKNITVVRLKSYKPRRFKSSKILAARHVD